MPEIFCDTSPIQYLFQAGWLEILPRLYGRIVVPQAVAGELACGRKLGVALPDISQLPWLSVRPVPQRFFLANPGDLDAGELEVLSLAKRTKDSLAIIDDALARRYARLNGITVTGTCGLLLKAKQLGIIPALQPILDHLNDLGFFLDPATRSAILRLGKEA
jgi:predicted nucleic acid-binding protein